MSTPNTPAGAANNAPAEGQGAATGQPADDGYRMTEPPNLQSQAGLNDFGGSEQGEPQSPAEQQQEPQVPTPPPQGEQQGQQTPQPGESDTTPSAEPLKAFMEEYGLDEGQAVEMARNFAYYSSPEGRQQFLQAQQEWRDATKQQTVTEELGKMLSTETGRYGLWEALKNAGGPPGYTQQQQAPPDGTQEGEYGEPGAGQLGQQLSGRMAALEQSIKGIAEELAKQQTTTTQQVESTISPEHQQLIANEFHSWMQKHPEAAGHQQMLSQDVLELVQANRAAYEGRPGAIEYAANRAWQKYRRSQGLFGGGQQQAPLNSTPAGNAGGIVQKRHGAPPTGADLTKAILEDVNSFTRRG